MEYKGYQFNFVLQEMGHFCAYVKIPKGHPYYGKAYDDINLNVHGGLTFSEHIKEDDPYIELGFTPGYWVGWDYAHAGDLIPKLGNFLDVRTSTEKRWQPFEVIDHCKDAINQLMEADVQT